MDKGWLTITAAAGLALSGCTTTGSLFGMGGQTTTSHGPYSAAAAASDLFEIESANVAMTKAQRPEVRAFAEMVLRSHTQASQALAGAAQRDGWVPPAGILDAGQKVMLNQLLNAGPNTADALYVSQQIAAHERAYNLHRAYGLSGDSPQLREFAIMIAPIVQQHLQAAQRL